MPSGFGASLGALPAFSVVKLPPGLCWAGSTGAWKMGVASNRGQMNPLFWDWKDPDKVFEVFSGFAMPFGLFGPVGNLQSFGKDLMKYGTFAYIAFASATGSTAFLAAYGNCALTNGEANPSKWNWKEIWVDYDFVGRVRFGNRNAVADGGGERPVRPVPQNRKIYKFRIHNERNKNRRSP